MTVTELLRRTQETTTMHDNYREHCDHEDNARFDDHRERYASSSPDARAEHESWLDTDPRDR